MSIARKLAIALSLSLALNIFAAGFFVARTLRHDHDRRHGGPFFGPSGLLSDGDGDAPKLRSKVREVMGRHETDMRRGRRELRAVRRGVREALAAEPFDRAALEAALAEMREQTSRSQASLHAALVDLAQTLPPEQRRRLGGRRAGLLDGRRPHHRRPH